MHALQPGHRRGDDRVECGVSIVCDWQVRDAFRGDGVYQLCCRELRDHDGDVRVHALQRGDGGGCHRDERFVSPVRDRDVCGLDRVDGVYELPGGELCDGDGDFCLYELHGRDLQYRCGEVHRAVRRLPHWAVLVAEHVHGVYSLCGRDLRGYDGAVGLHELFGRVVQRRGGEDDGVRGVLGRTVLESGRVDGLQFVCGGDVRAHDWADAVHELRDWDCERGDGADDRVRRVPRRAVHQPGGQDRV